MRGAPMAEPCLRMSCWMLCFALAGVPLLKADAPATPREPLPGLIGAPRSLPGVGRWQLAFAAPHGRITAVAWSPDGEEIIYSERGYLRVADAGSLRTKRYFVGHTGR